MPFVRLNISILPGNVTVDFPIVLLKSFLVACESMTLFYIGKSWPASVKRKISCDFVVKLLVDLVTIARFT